MLGVLRQEERRPRRAAAGAGLRGHRRPAHRRRCGPPASRSRIALGGRPDTPDPGERLPDRLPHRAGGADQRDEARRAGQRRWSPIVVGAGLGRRSRWSTTAAAQRRRPPTATGPRRRARPHRDARAGGGVRRHVGRRSRRRRRLPRAGPLASTVVAPSAEHRRDPRGGGRRPGSWCAPASWCCSARPTTSRWWARRPTAPRPSRWRRASARTWC